MADEYLREYRLSNVDNSDSTDNWIDWFTTEALPRIPKIEANWSWHDQGWGNQKGRIRAVLLRNGAEVAALQIGPIASHEQSDQHFVATEGELFEKSQFGDNLKFQYIVGGGGGHTLHIGNFVVKVFERIEEFALPNVDNSESTDNWIDWFTTGALPAISKIEATWSWHDQGWGNLKGTIRAVLLRNGAEVATLQIGPIASHEPKVEHFTASKVGLINQSQDGDVLKFQYLVGGGGGHTLHIENFVVKIYPRSLRDYRLPNVANTNSTDDWIDWFTTDKLAAIRSVVGDWNWHDQGWGNLKGRIRAVLTRDGQEVANVQLGPIAGHADSAVHFVVTDGEVINLSQDGDVLKFQYVVGGGGGHQLFINNFIVKIFG